MEKQISLFENINEEIINIESTKKINIEKGDIYVLGKHRLMCGDSTNFEDIKTLTQNNKIDIIYTDPPYNVSFNGRSGKFEVIENDNLGSKEFELFIKKIIENVKIINAENIYIWCNWKFYGLLQSLIDFNACIVWAKNVFGMGVGYRHQHEFCLFKGEIDVKVKNESDLWKVAKDTNYIHPTQKPIQLCIRALKNHKENKTVLDLFGGSGSTLIGCEQMNKICYIMEIDPIYVEKIIYRWENYTKQKVIKEDA